jgi:hypothetical protein
MAAAAAHTQPHLLWHAAVQAAGGAEQLSCDDCLAEFKKLEDSDPVTWVYFMQLAAAPTAAKPKAKDAAAQRGSKRGRPPLFLVPGTVVHELPNGLKWFEYGGMGFKHAPLQIGTIKGWAADADSRRPGAPPLRAGASAVAPHSLFRQAQEAPGDEPQGDDAWWLAEFIKLKDTDPVVWMQHTQEALRLSLAPAAASKPASKGGKPAAKRGRPPLPVSGGTVVHALSRGLKWFEFKGMGFKHPPFELDKIEAWAELADSRRAATLAARCPEASLPTPEEYPLVQLLADDLAGEVDELPLEMETAL